MNRREKRSIEKKLNLTKFYSKQPLNKRLERISQNIESGKKRHEEFSTKIEVKLQEQRDAKHSSVVENNAEHIAISKGIPYIDALKEANNQI